MSDDPHSVCLAALVVQWRGEETAAGVVGYMDGALQAARLPLLNREAAISAAGAVNG